MEDPDLNVLATIRRAGADQSTHILRIKSGSNQSPDYLIAFECLMSLRDGPEPRYVVVEKRQAPERLISETEKLPRNLPHYSGNSTSSN